MTPSFSRNFFFFIFLFANLVLPAQKSSEPKNYPDGRGGIVHLPQGDISFADKVISYMVGDPAPILRAADSSKALGPPDWKGDSNFVTLGCGGSLVLQFTDNALVNIDGPDLYVFEVGKFIEPTLLSISKDGKKWIEVGVIRGGTAAVDIGDSVRSGEKFNYVKLTDLKTECEGLWPGADIDAVAAIGSGTQISLNSAVLFNTGSAVLKPEAVKELGKVLEQVKNFPGVQLVVEGHTDNVGSESGNQVLSEKRAKAVAAYFESALKGKKLKLKYYGYGAQYPVAPNDSASGREKNRRVELVILPLKP
ncbi:MAG TPA: OmpA family protein [Bacteroidia bacterium]|jgi:OOP family OmpA-OmpF porin|nr:OmpA family protein [Bacteroidia bacterium]